MTPKIAPTSATVFNYFLPGRGGPSGYHAYVSTFDGSAPSFEPIAIDDELKKNPKDKRLIELRAQAIKAIADCYDNHANFHRIQPYAGPLKPKAYRVFCDPRSHGGSAGGCGSLYGTCDKDGGWDNRAVEGGK